jgi:hypothetical protein
VDIGKLLFIMKKVFIIHGSHGYPEENWFPWLKIELEKLGNDVIVPKFPTPKNQTLGDWIKVISKYDIDNGILIGHSLGVAFILSLLEKHKAKACFFVAGFISKLGNEFDNINVSFIDKKFNFDKIKKNCERFVVFQSDNDPYVSVQHGKELAEKVDGELIIVKNAGHFNSKAGYDRFDELLEQIKSSLSKP